MRAPLSWLREHAAVPAEATGRDVAERLIAAGLEVEGVEVLGADVVGPLVVGRVDAIEEFTASNGKTIRFCQVDVGPGLAPADAATRGIICGARNFAVGDHVVVALPGAVLPGGFQIASRKTYGHVSDGMICSVRELGIGDDHAGILVLGEGWTPGHDLEPDLRLRDDVLDVAITPDRGYCMSIRGLARELATSYGVAFDDPAGTEPTATTAGPAVALETSGCDRFVAVALAGLDRTAPSPLWMRGRLHRSGIRPISLAVDVTNYVQLELGQPLHAYDAATLAGTITVRDARPDETVRTLDGSDRTLLAHDVVITDAGAGGDASRVIGVAGVMGGEHTEIGPSTTDVVLEAAHFDPVAVSRTGRRLGLASEAAKRFERGVDPALQLVAAIRAAALLVEHGGARVTGVTDVGEPAAPAAIAMAADHVDRVAGDAYGVDVVVGRLVDVGCTVAVDGERLVVTPPTWRPDLRQPNDLAEEVIRLQGYETLPSVLPQAPAGRGLTGRQRLRRAVGRALAGAGYVEVLPSPFVGDEVLDGLGIDTDDERRRLVRLANPLSAEEPYLRPLLLADLLPTLRRNVGRGTSDVGLFELGRVFVEGPGGRDADAEPERPAVSHRPADDELARLDASLPHQPEHVTVVLAGARTAGGWWGSAEPATWADAVEAARTVAAAVGVEVTVRAAEQSPWHPGRCAAVERGGVVVGWAGELHPRVVGALDLPPRTVAMELDLELLAAGAGAPVAAPAVSAFPVAKEDLALVVADHVAVADVASALRDGAGPLLEELRLFDVWTGDPVPEGHRSLAFHLRLRAPDRTLTADESAAVRAAALAEAASRTGATIRS